MCISRRSRYTRICCRGPYSNARITKLHLSNVDVLAVVLDSKVDRLANKITWRNRVLTRLGNTKFLKPLLKKTLLYIGVSRVTRLKLVDRLARKLSTRVNITTVGDDDCLTLS